MPATGMEPAIVAVVVEPLFPGVASTVEAATVAVLAHSERAQRGDQRSSDAGDASLRRQVGRIDPPHATEVGALDSGAAAQKDSFTPV